jgi:hypothetical protein
MSLARAFLHAGAGATVSTLWDLPDAPGPIFADVLYRELAAGRPLAAAVAGARRELRRRGAPPSAWAAYVLTGNPGARVGVVARVDARAVSARFAGGVGLVLMLAAVFLRRAPAPWRSFTTIAAVAGCGLAAAALVLYPWPADYPGSAAASRAGRAVTQPALAASVDGDRLAWSPVPGADEHQVEVYDAAGLPVDAPVTATAPYVLPQTAGGWVRINARHGGQTMPRSKLIRLE